MALARIEIKQAIGSLNDETPVGRLCLRFYEHCRQTMLREFPWSFCEQYYTLALVASDPNPRWSYAYRYPTGVVRVNDIVDSSGIKIPSPRIPYKIGSDSQGRLIYTDEVDAVIAANTDISDTSQMDPMFIDSLAWRLAMELAGPLSENTGAVNTARGMYEISVRRAMAACMNEEAAEEYQGGLMEARS
jgi:hypothetical protein